MNRVCIVGMGYVGLTTAACFADRGIPVHGIEIDAGKLARLQAGKPHFYEPGLEEKIRSGLEKGTLKFTDSYEPIRDANIIFITVGTPGLPDGSANLEYVASAAASIGKAMRDAQDFKVVATKSTVPPGTSHNVVRPNVEKNSGKRAFVDFGVCSNPEFLKEGSAVEDTLDPDRVVIGAEDDRTLAIMSGLYSQFYGDGEVPVVSANITTSEIIKYANNAFLATKISFINTIANICNNVPGADVEKVAEGIGLDRRVGRLFLKAGLGYGGSCFPKDVKALISFAKSTGYTPDLLIETHHVNQLQPLRVVEMAEAAVESGRLQGRTVSLLGLAFKSNTDDMREAVSVTIARELVRRGCRVRAHDPMAIENARAVLGDGGGGGSMITYCGSAEECLKGADAAIVVTDWAEYKKIGPEVFNKLMNSSNIIDGRRIYDPKEFAGRVRSFAAIGYGADSAATAATATATATTTTSMPPREARKEA